MHNGSTKRYLRDVSLPMLLLSVVLALMSLFAKQVDPAGRIGFLLALTLCYGWMGWTEFRHLRQCDELRRRLELEAMMLAFIASIGVLLLLFFADSLKLLVVPFAAAPLTLGGCYMACVLWTRLRYRYWAMP